MSHAFQTWGWFIFLSKIGSLTPSFGLISYSSFSFLSPSQLLLMAFSSPPAFTSHVLFLIFFSLFFPPFRVLLTFHYYLYSLFPSQIRTPPQYSHFFLLHHFYKPLLTLRPLPPNPVIVPQNHMTFFVHTCLFC